MITSTEMNVQGAFELLIESLEEEVNGINHTGAAAFERGDYPAVDTMRTRVDAITALREKVLALRNEWEHIMPPPDDETTKEDGEPVSRRDLGRLPKGMRTPNREFELPILKALAKLGGKARMAEVLDTVGELMKEKLGEADYQPLPSDPDAVRWRNTAQWTRFTLVKQGDMSPDSPRGVWEITEQGRQRVKEQQ
jgi:restriction system protein